MHEVVPYVVIVIIAIGGVGAYMIVFDPFQPDDYVEIDLSSIQVSGNFSSLDIFHSYDTYSNWDGSFRGTVITHCITVKDNEEHDFEIESGLLNEDTFYIIAQLITLEGEEFSFDFYATTGEAYEFSYTPPAYSSGITIELMLVP